MGKFGGFSNCDFVYGELEEAQEEAEGFLPACVAKSGASDGGERKDGNPSVRR